MGVGSRGIGAGVPLLCALLFLTPASGQEQTAEESTPSAAAPDTTVADTATTASPASAPDPATDAKRRRSLPGGLWWNRVDGAHGEARLRRKLGERLSALAIVGYSTGSKRWSHGATVTRLWGRGGDGSVSVSYQRGTQVRFQSDNYGIDLNSIPYLLGFDDYFDYYWNERWRGEVDYLFLDQRLRLAVGINAEKHSSLAKTSNYDLFGRVDERRPNPPVEEGALRSVEARLVVGGPRLPFGTPQRRLEAWAEHSRSSLGSDFSFTLYRARVDWRAATLWRTRARPATLVLRLTAGTFTGELPVQRFGALDVRIWRVTPYGGFKAVRDRPYEGDQYVALFWEHDLGAAPLALLGLEDWRNKTLGLKAFGASGRTWVDEDKRDELGYVPRFPDAFHHEVGLALTLFEYFRVDWTRRLDERDWNVGFAVAWYEF